MNSENEIRFGGKDIIERLHGPEITQQLQQENQALRESLSILQEFHNKGQEEITRLREALKFYADPENYHAIAFIGDSPCGEFANDFSECKNSGYDRPMPGKLAREALAPQEGKQE